MSKIDAEIAAHRDEIAALRDAAVALVTQHWPDADLDVVETGLRHATFAVGV